MTNEPNPNIVVTTERAAEATLDEERFFYANIILEDLLKGPVPCDWTAPEVLDARALMFVGAPRVQTCFDGTVWYVYGCPNAPMNIRTGRANFNRYMNCLDNIQDL